MKTFPDQLVNNMSLAELDRYADYLTHDQLKSRFVTITIDVAYELKESEEAMEWYEDLEQQVSNLEYELDEARRDLEDARDNCTERDDLIFTIQEFFDLMRNNSITFNCDKEEGDNVKTKLKQILKEMSELADCQLLVDLIK